jgi:LytS/YehU family sensor histidine kinase
MLLQTIVENSIKHGVRQLKHKGTIKLEIAKIDSKTYKCIIEDNGIGRVKSAQINTDQRIKKESLGLKLIRERLNILNKGEDGPFKIEIIDLYSDKGMSVGTRVEITLAFILSYQC